MSRKPIRERAEAEGRTRYHGKVCHRHPEMRGERHTANGTCVGCQVAYQARRNASVPEANRRATAKWREANRERLNAMVADWRVKNKDRRSATENARRAKKLGATPSWLSDSDYRSIAGQYSMASLMSYFVGIDYHVDHIVPLQGRGVRGLHVPWNLRVIRASENVRKGNRMEI